MRILLSLTLLLLCPLFAAAQYCACGPACACRLNRENLSLPKGIKFAGFADATTTYTNTLVEAKKAGKSVLVVVCGNNCPDCDKLKETLAKMPQKVMDQLLVVHFNRDVDDVSWLGCKAGVPAYLLLDPATGYIACRGNGYQTVPELEQWLKNEPVVEYAPAYAPAYAPVYVPSYQPRFRSFRSSGCSSCR